MYPKLLFMVALFLFLGNPSEENDVYQRDYYPTGKLKSEGWMKNGAKTAYWKFYHSNGRLSEEGHYRNNQRVAYWKFYADNGRPLQKGHYKNGEKWDWWLFYDTNGSINHKCQLKNGKKNGYCLKYENEELASAEKYTNGKKIKEWYSFSSFTKENSLSDLK
ncbi:MAG: hypothetical protein WBG48_19500 [Pricia sp.]